jgi:outer membrane protein assembly factor BamD
LANCYTPRRISLVHFISMKAKFLPRAACVLLALAIGACSSNPDKAAPVNPFKPDPNRQTREEKFAADKLYRLARDAMEGSDYNTAITRYDQLTTRHPFTEYATQGEMERIFCYFRNYQDEQALAGADRFLRDHPRHPHADYVQYLRGLINAQKDEPAVRFIPQMDPALSDVSSSRRAFDDFALLIQKYPASQYVGDARLRMIDLRNRIAESEMNVVDFYMRRGAWLAAAKRAEHVVSDYPGAPATVEALASLEKCYDKLGLKNQADDVRKLRAAEKAAG